MTDIYSSKQRAIIFSIIFIVSFIISLVYLFKRIDYKKNSLVIFFLCVIYTTFFVALNIIAAFDMETGRGDKYVKFSKFISDFYTAFNIVDKILGNIISYILIYYFESGQFTTIQKLFDFLLIYFNKIKKMGKFKIILILSIGIPILGGILVALIVSRKRFGLRSPLEYISIILDCYAVFKIYVSVGFFVIQFIIDYRRQKSYKLIVRYYRYSVIKIVEKTEKYIQNMKKSFEGLNKAVQNYKEDKSTTYYKYLEGTLHEIDEKIKKIELESNNDNNINIMENYNLNNNNEIMNNMYNNNNPNNYYIYNNQNYNNYIYNNQNYNNYIYNNEPYINNNYMFNQNMNFNRRINENNRLKNHLQTENRLDTDNRLKTNTEDKIQKTDKDKKDEEEKKKKKEEEKYDTPEKCIKKYKRAIRRIEKLKKLNQEIKHESQLEINKVGTKRKCTCTYIIRIIAFIIIILTDILLPISLSKKDEYSSSSSESDTYSASSDLSLAILVLLSIPFTVICCSYTIVLIYATKRRRYITGDFLYDKQINDDISLMKTVQLVCGFSFALLYCNFYFWRSIDSNGEYGRPNFYDRTIIPDYTFKQGVSVVMIAKLVIIFVSIIGELFFSKFLYFKNDLSEYNLSIGEDKYDNDIEFNNFLEEKMKIIILLYREN